MMTQQLGFSILCAPLAAIDRRALSQAWYSALHLARDRSPSPAIAALPHVARPEHLQPAGAIVARGEARLHDVTLQRAHGAAGSAGRMDAPAERRLPRSPLARSIERTFLDPTRRVQRATFTIDGTNARVHVTLQDISGGLHLVAVCAPAARAGVSRALEEARFALASRGIALRIDVSGALAC